MKKIKLSFIVDQLGELGWDYTCGRMSRSGMQIYDEMKADGYDIVITEKEMQVLAAHRCEEFKEYMRPLFA